MVGRGKFVLVGVNQTSYEINVEGVHWGNTHDLHSAIQFGNLSTQEKGEYFEICQHGKIVYHN